MQTSPVLTTPVGKIIFIPWTQTKKKRNISSETNKFLYSTCVNSKSKQVLKASLHILRFQDNAD